jgi:hypothetical protein
MDTSFGQLLDEFVRERDAVHGGTVDDQRRARLENIEFTLQRLLEKLRDTNE